MSAVPAVATHCPYCALQCGIHFSTGGAGRRDRRAERAVSGQQGRAVRQGLVGRRTLAHPERLRSRCAAGRRAAGAGVVGDGARDDRRTVPRVQAQHGRDAVGVFGGGSLTNEKAYLLGKFARVALGTANIDYNGRFCMSSAAAAATQRVRHRSRAAVSARRHRARVGHPARRRQSGRDDAADHAVLRGAAAERRAADRRRPATDGDRALGRRTTCRSGRAPTRRSPTGCCTCSFATVWSTRRTYRERTEGFDEARRVAMTYWPERVERITGIAEALLVDTAHRHGTRPERDDSDRARSRTAGAGRDQRARLHQPRAGARRGRQAAERLRHADRPGQRTGRTRARAEGRSASRLSTHRRPGGQAPHRGGLERAGGGHPARGQVRLRDARLRSAATYARCSSWVRTRSCRRPTRFGSSAVWARSTRSSSADFFLSETASARARRPARRAVGRGGRAR